MGKLVRAAAIIILPAGIFLHCVVKKDTAASAATSAALAKKIAQGLSGGSTAPSAVQPGGPSAAVTLNCSTTLASGMTSSTTTCTSDTFDFYWAYGSDGTISGYEKFKAYSMTESSQNYQLNGQINYAGTSATSYPANYATITTTTSIAFNGTLAVSGADSFSVTYKNYKVNTVGTYTAATFSYQYSQTCSGTLTVDTIDYAIQPDCSIVN